MNEPSMAMIGLAMLSLAVDHVQRATAATQGARLRKGLVETLGDSRSSVMFGAEGQGHVPSR